MQTNIEQNNVEEIWKVIESYPNYEVSSLGSVRNIKNGNTLKANRNPIHGAKVTLGNKQLRVKNLMADAFLPKEHGKNKVCFINKNKTDLRLSNLFRTTGGTHLKKRKKKIFNAKFCTLCEIGYSYHYFWTNKHGHLSQFCKKCSVLKNKKWRDKNRLRHSVTRNNYVKKKRNDNPSFRLLLIVRSCIGSLLRKSKVKKSRTSRYLLGCDSVFYKEYLEKQFDKNMSWENYGSYWQIDHIVPLSLFDLTDIEQQKTAFHYSNTRPLEKFANLSKGNKLTEPQIKLPL